MKAHELLDAVLTDAGVETGPGGRDAVFRIAAITREAAAWRGEMPAVEQVQALSAIYAAYMVATSKAAANAPPKLRRTLEWLAEELHRTMTLAPGEDDNA